MVLIPSGTPELDPRHDLFNHSPDGFEWGYGGSGPAQLALAILADLFQSRGALAGPGAAITGDELAVALHQDFKREVVSGLPHGRWQLSEREIDEALDKIEAVETF